MYLNYVTICLSQTSDSSIPLEFKIYLKQSKKALIAVRQMLYGRTALNLSTIQCILDIFISGFCLYG